MSDEPFLVYCDGGCLNNGQPNSRMIVVVMDHDGRILIERTKAGGTNNLAELSAIVQAVEWAARTAVPALHLISDSQCALTWARPGGAHERADVRERQVRLALARQSVAVTMEWRGRAENPAGHYIERKYRC